MNNQDSLTIHILDKEYRVACPSEEQESLKESANQLNSRLSDIKSRGSVIGTERIAIMAALNLSHEVLQGKAIESEHISLNNRLDMLSERIETTLRDIRVG
jgi:cell division protein ZapA